ncbi:MAG: hypothetical protein ACT4O4_13000 [Nitrospiraceae bacterium]
MRERVVTLVIIGLVLLYALWTIRSQSQVDTPAVTGESTQTHALSPELIPLVTGEESIIEIFTRAGCPVCHTIPGIPGANGQVGPRLNLGTTGMWRISDPGYQGQARTVRDYIVESVLEPGRFLVPGYPDRTMPTWYGSKLSALALEKIASYLTQQAE